MLRVALAVPILLCLMLAGCSRDVAETDLVGTWGGYLDMSDLGEELGDMSEFDDIPGFVLELQSGGKFEMHSFAGTWFGEWRTDGDKLLLDMTGMDDGYRDSREDGSEPALWRQFQMDIRSKDEFVWKFPDGGDAAEDVIFRRKPE